MLWQGSQNISLDVSTVRLRRFGFKRKSEGCCAETVDANSSLWKALENAGGNSKANSNREPCAPRKEITAVYLPAQHLVPPGTFVVCQRTLPCSRCDHVISKDSHRSGSIVLRYQTEFILLITRRPVTALSSIPDMLLRLCSRYERESFQSQRQVGQMDAGDRVDSRLGARSLLSTGVGASRPRFAHDTILGREFA